MLASLENFVLTPKSVHVVLYGPKQINLCLSAKAAIESIDWHTELTAFTRFHDLF